MLCSKKKYCFPWDKYHGVDAAHRVCSPFHTGSGLKISVMVSLQVGTMSDLPGFKKFVSEDELAEQKKKRQEEWEKVRKPDDPIGECHHVSR